MPTFRAPDGTELAYHLRGTGEPLICLPGGPMAASAYLGDLGGLSAHRQLVLLDLRGTGDSAVPDAPSTYRCDRQIDDVEALREHLGLERIDLLGHSAGGSLALLYAAAHPERLSSLVLLTPGPRAVGIRPDEEEWERTVGLFADEPWYAETRAAIAEFGPGTPLEKILQVVAPLSYARWDAAARAHCDATVRNWEAASGYYAEGLPDPAATRAALAAVTA
ncbi:alpha/beta fold hydrolase, partial [Streptomyces sp. T-3]|nr:alpha/beta fold hydrolase [Streptomyces sp. T-3]